MSQDSNKGQGWGACGKCVKCSEKLSKSNVLIVVKNYQLFIAYSIVSLTHNNIHVGLKKKIRNSFRKFTFDGRGSAGGPNPHPSPTVP